MTPEFWLNLQRMYDLDVARAKTDVSAIDRLWGDENEPALLFPEAPIEVEGEGAYAAYELRQLPAAAVRDPEPDEPYGPKRKGG